MAKQLMRLYLDTSVYSGVFNPGFASDSKRLIDAIHSKKCVVLISDMVIAEISRAPKHIQELVAAIPRAQVVSLAFDVEVERLQQEYLSRKILTSRSENDAAHVAFATVFRADAIISWNFRDIVRLDKMKKYNQVNFSMGYGVLTIISPKEVAFDE
jgi:predicted nucleic acid-binding protein